MYPGVCAQFGPWALYQLEARQNVRRMLQYSYKAVCTLEERPWYCSGNQQNW